MVKINNSSITGNYSVENYAEAYVSSTALDGTIHQYAGVLKCVGVYNALYEPITCP